MPDADADALTYLLTVFTLLARPVYEDGGSHASGSGADVQGSHEKRPLTNFGDIARSFGWDVCAPRDAVGYLASIRMLGLVDTSESRLNDPSQVPLMVKERAEATVQHMSRQVLWWLLCYWSEIRFWRDDHRLLEPSRVPTVSRDSPANAEGT